MSVRGLLSFYLSFLICYNDIISHLVCKLEQINVCILPFSGFLNALTHRRRRWQPDVTGIP